MRRSEPWLMTAGRSRQEEQAGRAGRKSRQEVQTGRAGRESRQESRQRIEQDESIKIAIVSLLSYNKT